MANCPVITEGDEVFETVIETSLNKFNDVICKLPIYKSAEVNKVLELNFKYDKIISKLDTCLARMFYNGKSALVLSKYGEYVMTDNVTKVIRASYISNSILTGCELLIDTFQDNTGWYTFTQLWRKENNAVYLTNQLSNKDGELVGIDKLSDDLKEVFKDKEVNVERLQTDLLDLPVIIFKLPKRHNSSMEKSVMYYAEPLRKRLVDTWNKLKQETEISGTIHVLTELTTNNDLGEAISTTTFSDGLKKGIAVVPESTEKMIKESYANVSAMPFVDIFKTLFRDLISILNDIIRLPDFSTKSEGTKNMHGDEVASNQFNTNMSVKHLEDILLPFWQEYGMKVLNYLGIEATIEDCDCEFERIEEQLMENKGADANGNQQPKENSTIQN